MMIKFMLGVAVVAFATFVGFLLGRKHRKRKQFFTQFCLFNERFINEISYYRHPLQDFIMKYEYKSEFSSLLQRFLYCVDKRVALKGNLLNDADFDFLKADEKNVVEDYFLMLGKGDSASQKTYFNSMKEQLISMEKLAINTCKRYGDLYIKLGFLCGLFILIIIL